MSWTPKYTVNQEILACLMRIEKAKESFEKAPLSPKLLASLHQSAKLASTHFSTQIEGNELSLEDVKSAVSGGAKFASGKIGRLLRALDVKQRQILSLFTTYQEVTSAQAGAYLGLSAQSARLLLNKWVQGGFLEIGRSAKKNRTYKLSAEYEKLIF